MSETFAAFLTTDPLTTRLPAPAQASDRVAVVRGALTYWALLSDLSPSYQLVTPATGNTITATAGLGAFIIDPAGELATLNMVLPPAPVDGQVFEASTVQTLDALTVTAPAGATVLGGGPLILTANRGISWRYHAANTTWYRRF